MNELAWLALGSWVFVALLIRADATRRYGKAAGGNWLVWSAVGGVVTWAVYLIHRIGHAPVELVEDAGEETARFRMPWSATTLVPTDRDR